MFCVLFKICCILIIFLVTFGSLMKLAGVAQLVEHHLAKVNVASSSLVSRSKLDIHSLKGFQAV